MIRAQVSHLFTQIWATIYSEKNKGVAWHYDVHKTIRGSCPPQGENTPHLTLPALRTSCHQCQPAEYREGNLM
jgi:succinylglutamate desuccinylase